MRSKVRVEDIAKKITIGPFGSRLKSDRYVPQGVPVIRGTNVTGGKEFSGDWVFVPEETADSLESCCVYAGDLVFPHRGSIGEVGLVPDDFPRYVMSSSLMKLSCDREKADPAYVYYFFKSAAGRHELLKNASQVGTPGIGQPLTSLKNIEIPLPALSEQKAIARVLSSLDGKIALNQQVNKTLEKMAQAIFKSWFIDFDPVRAKMAGRQPEGMDTAASALFPSMLMEVEPSIGMMPQGWEAISLYDTAAYVNGAAFKANDFSTDGSGLPIIKIAELKQGVAAQTKFTEKDFQPKYSIDSGDVCYSWSGSPETSLDVFRWLGGPGWLNQHIFKLVCLSQKQKVFAYYLLKQMRPILVQTAMDKQTTGLGHVTVADMKRIKVVYPDSAALEMFYEKVKPLYEQCELLEKQCSALEQLRNSLLPKLLSGEVVVVGG